MHKLNQLDQKYFLPSKALHPILQAKGVTSLFHANTVSTSLTFIRNRALLSRGYVANNGLIQTSQKSDEADEKYNVWDDVFMDGLDLHKKYGKPNNYGPVLFVLKLELLLSPSFPHVLVTKNNPWFWKPSESWDDRYYSDIKEVEKDYLSGGLKDVRIMFTLRSPGTNVKLNKYLDFIWVDKPNILINLRSGGQKNVGDYAIDLIKKTMLANGLGHIPVTNRHPKGNFFGCLCNARYTFMWNTNPAEFKMKFQGTP